MKEPLWIEERDARALHEKILGLHGGLPGVRDEGLSQSSLARPKQLHAYGKNPDVIDLAAAYAVGVARNHAFLDGNKRTAFVVSVLFLELNGYVFTASEEQATHAMLGVAEGSITEQSFALWLRENAVRRRKRR